MKRFIASRALGLTSLLLLLEVISLALLSGFIGHRGELSETTKKSFRSAVLSLCPRICSAIFAVLLQPNFAERTAWRDMVSGGRGFVIELTSGGNEGNIICVEKLPASVKGVQHWILRNYSILKLRPRWEACPGRRPHCL